MEMAALVQFLGSSVKLGKANIIFAASNRPSVLPHGTTRFKMNGFLLNLIFVDFSKTCYNIPGSLKPAKNSRYFRWRLMYIYDNISLNSPQNEKFSDKSSSEYHSTHFIFKIFLPKSCLLWVNVEKHGTARQVTEENIIGGMRNACWITWLQTNTQNMWYLLLYHANNCYANATQCVSCLIRFYPPLTYVN